MAVQIPFRTLPKILLDSARDHWEVNESGGFIAVFAASSPSALIKVRFNDPAGVAVPMKLGVAVKQAAFSRLFIDNDQQSGEWVQLVVWGKAADVQPALFDVHIPPAAGAVEIVNEAVPVDLVNQTGGPMLVSLAESVVPVVVQPDPLMPLKVVNADFVDVENLVEDTIVVGSVSTTSTTFFDAVTVPAGKRMIIRKCQLTCSSALTYASARIVVGAVTKRIVMTAGENVPLTCFENHILPPGAKIQHKVDSGTTNKSFFAIDSWCEAV